MMGRETPETCWATRKRQVTNLWNCCILLVELFASYDDARTYERHKYSSHFSEIHLYFNIAFVAWSSRRLRPPRVPTRTLCTVHFCCPHQRHMPVYLTPLYVTTQQQYLSSTNQKAPNYAVFPSILLPLLDPNISLSTLFSNTFSFISTTLHQSTPLIIN